MSSRPVRQLLTLVMDVLVVVAVVLVLHVVVEFFGALAMQPWGRTVVAATGHLVVPLNVEAIGTPYGGAFDVDAGLTVLLLLAVEWALGAARGAS